MSKYIGHLNNVHSSILLLAQNTINQIKSQGISPNLEFIDLLAHSVIDEWPPVDLLGLGSFSLEIPDVSNVIVTVGFAVSTFNDPNLFRHQEIMNVLFDKVIPMTSHDVIDATSGNVVGSMTVQGGTQLAQMERTENRPLQFELATFATSLTYSSIGV